jgi:Cu-Zn family superoxide dismutase
MKNISKILLTSSAALILAACGGDTTTEDTAEAPTDTTEETTEQTQPAEETEPVEESEEAAESQTDTEIEPVTVEMVNSDEEVAGTATFEEAADGVTLTLDLEGLPEGEFGMHIHEVGMATPPTFEDAGSHFNPTDVEHGINSETGPHVGDLPNLEVPADGVVQETVEIPNTTLEEGGENSLHNNGQGTALIIHTGADDYETQPTGDAGDRMLGGVIIPGSQEE